VRRWRARSWSRLRDDGTVEILTRGYVGRACVDEVERLVRRLRELGVKVETGELVPSTRTLKTSR
jgi:hypothetical protein